MCYVFVCVRCCLLCVIDCRCRLVFLNVCFLFQRVVRRVWVVMLFSVVLHVNVFVACLYACVAQICLCVFVVFGLFVVDCLCLLSTVVCLNMCCVVGVLLCVIVCLHIVVDSCCCGMFVLC